MTKYRTIFRIILMSALCIVAVLLTDVVTLAEAPYNIAWSRQLGTTEYDYSHSVAVDASGNAYISGYTAGSLAGPNAGSSDAFLTKYDGAGSVLWSRQIGTAGTDVSDSIAVDTSGNIYIGGGTAGSLGGPSAGTIDAFLTKYDGAGSVLWSRQIGTTVYDSCHTVAVDTSGNVYISGETEGSLGGPNAGSSDAFLTKYNSSGNLQWSRQIGTADYDISTYMALDASGNAYISGWTYGSLGGPSAGTIDAFLTKYDSAGNVLWSRQLGTTDFDVSYSVAVDASGNAYMSGTTAGSLGGPNAGGDDAFLTKYDGAGNVLWSRQIGTGADDTSRSVAVDPSGNAYISGYTFGSLGGPAAGFFDDAFLTKYDSAGNVLWSRQIGTTEVDVSYSVAVDPSGNAYISGYTAGSLGGPNAGGYDAFLIKFAVPEPASFILLALGLPFLVGRNPRRLGSGGTRGGHEPMTVSVVPNWRTNTNPR
jgi:hypothetical protein